MSTAEASHYDKMAEAVLKFQYPNTTASLLPSNYPPGLVDRATIQEQLSACDSIITSLENKLHNNDAAADITELQSRIVAYRKYQDFKRYLLSPVRDIPDEILARIFTYVHTGCLHIFGDESSDFWNVLRVCVRWRNVAQSIASFWSKFNIGYYNLSELYQWEDNDSAFESNSDSSTSDSDDVPHEASMCRHRVLKCLQNSQNNLLDISIIFLDDDTASIYPQSMASIAKHCDRWEAIEINDRVGHEDVLDLDEVKLLIETRGLPKLRKLEYIGYTSNPHAMAVYDVFCCAAALEELVIRDTDYFPDILHGRFPWSNLRKITFQGCSDMDDPGYIFRNNSALRNMPFLQELILDDCCFAINEGDSEIAFPALHTFHLDPNRHRGSHIPDDYPFISYPFCPLMITPNLTTLKLGGYIQNTSEIVRLLEMIKSSGCTVKSLELGLKSDSGTVDIAVQIVERLGMVEELKLVTAQGYIGSLLEYLASNDPLPILTKLIVKPTDGTNVDLASKLIDYIGSRENTSLTQVILSDVSANKNKFESSIQQLKEIGRETGIDVEIG